MLHSILGGSPTDFELAGVRRIGLDAAVDRVPARLHLVEASNADFADGGGAGARDEITLYEADGGAPMLSLAADGRSSSSLTRLQRLRAARRKATP